MTIGTLEEVDALASDFERWFATCEVGNADGSKGTLVLDLKDQEKIAQLLRRHVSLLKVIFRVGQPEVAFTASVYLVNEGAILLVFHRRFSKWVPVGGRREPGERPHETALRELAEETGVRDAEFMKFTFGGLPGTPQGLIGYHEHDAGRGATHMNFAFGMTVNHRDIVPCDEFTDAKWVTAAEAGDLDMPENVRSIVYNLHKFYESSYPASSGTQ